MYNLLEIGIWLHESLKPSPYSTENIRKLNKNHSQDSDLIDSEYIQICKFLVENKNCYSAHRTDVRIFPAPIHSKLKPDAKLQTQILSKLLFPIE